MWHQSGTIKLLFQNYLRHTSLVKYTFKCTLTFTFRDVLKKFRLQETPTLSTKADSRADTDLKRLSDLSFKKIHRLRLMTLFLNSGKIYFIQIKKYVYLCFIKPHWYVCICVISICTCQNKIYPDITNLSISLNFSLSVSHMKTFSGNLKKNSSSFLYFRIVASICTLQGI